MSQREVSRRGFLGLVLGAGTAVASSTPAKAGFWDFLSGGSDNSKPEPHKQSGKGQRQTSGGNRPPPSDSPAYKYFAEIGKAIVEGRFNGKLDALVMMWDADNPKTHTRIALKPQGETPGFNFDKEAFRHGCMCKDGTEPKKCFDDNYLAMLGMLVYQAEEATPDKPANWPAGKPYEQQAWYTSIYRSPSHNKAQEGAGNSMHMYMMAADCYRIGKADPKVLNGIMFSNEVRERGIRVSSVYYRANSQRGAFTHSDVGHYRGNWKNMLSDVMARAAYAAFQKKHGITPFSMERCILKAPRAAEPLVAEPQRPHLDPRREAAERLAGLNTDDIFRTAEVAEQKGVTSILNGDMRGGFGR